MKKVTVSVQMEQEKVRAIQFYAGKRETTVEAELQEYLDKLYEKYVPVQTREYLESLGGGADRGHAGSGHPQHTGSLVKEESAR